MKKELIVFISIFFVLTIIFHYKEFLEYPIIHILSLPTSGAYGFGIFHPIVFTFIVYILLWILRLIGRLFKIKL